MIVLDTSEAKGMPLAIRIYTRTGYCDFGFDRDGKVYEYWFGVDWRPFGWYPSSVDRLRHKLELDEDLEATA